MAHDRSIGSHPVLTAATLAALSLATAAATPLGAQLVWDRSAAHQSTDSGISGFTVHAPFSVTERVFGVTATFWLDDETMNDNGVLDSFSGSLGWIVSADNGGAVGAAIASGTDASPAFADTGFQVIGGDQVRVTIELDGLPALAPGDYWVGIRETSPAAPDDGSSVYWALHSVFNSEHALALYAGTTTRDQSDVDLAGQFSDISDLVYANDFTLTSSTRLASLSFWLTDDSTEFNDTLDGFSGVLGWALYANDAGSPGNLLDSGSDATPRLTAVADHGSGGDVVLAEIELGDPVTLGAGTYWLALHEGPWLSTFDGTRIYWLDALSVVGNSLHEDPNETSPGAFPTVYTGFDSAFVLFERMIFGSGFEDGVTCAWTTTTGGATCP